MQKHEKEAGDGSYAMVGLHVVAVGLHVVAVKVEELAAIRGKKVRKSRPRESSHHPEHLIP